MGRPSEILAARPASYLISYLPDRFRKKKEIVETPEYCRGLTAKIVELIGGTQDDLLAAFRMSLKIHRQRAGQIHARSADQTVRDLMRNLRRLKQTILRISSPYEGH